MQIIKHTIPHAFQGCDAVVQLDGDRAGTEIRLLQLTDMQMIDAAQRRTPDRIRPDEIEAWLPERVDALCGDHIRSLIAQTHPDMIFITGDVTYGSFDDTGRSLVWFCELMDSFKIPWAPVFGNHDNESRMGVDWQCEQLEKSSYCLFKRGNVSGNGNYTVGVAVGECLVRVLHLMDSNGCGGGKDGEVVKEQGIFADQWAQIHDHTAAIAAAQGRVVPAFFGCHFPLEGFRLAEEAKGYRTAERDQYTIGVDVPASDGDFGCKREWFNVIKSECDLIPFLHEHGIEAVFAGHCHSINTCISYEGIRWSFGLKTGQYDYHVPGQVGGTLVRLNGDHFDIQHVPSLVPYSPYPVGAPMFNGFFAKG